MTRIRKGLAVGRRNFYRADLVGDVHLYVWCTRRNFRNLPSALQYSTLQYTAVHHSTVGTVQGVQSNSSAQLLTSKWYVLM